MDWTRDFAKSECRILRDLSALAWQRELELALAELEGKFAAWRSGEIDCHELSRAIHEFHNGPARTLYNLYTTLKPDVLVPRAVALEILLPNELPADLKEKMAQRITAVAETLGRRRGH